MISAADFQLLADLLKKRSGITLSEDKAYLLKSRLLPVARSRQMGNIAELCGKLRTQPGEDLLVEITEAMTINESSFFRDIKPYEQLRKRVFPWLMEKSPDKHHLRIWSAACSTGQEPYSVAMCIREDAEKMPGWTFDIVATDIAAKVVEKARLGVYSQFEAQRGLPIQMLIKYFTSLPDTSWRLKDEIRSMVAFHTLNLLEDYAQLGKFDIIFCRNVLIYFDEETRAAIIGKMARSLYPNGLLILGSTESLIDPAGRFMPFEEFRGAYRLK